MKRLIRLTAISHPDINGGKPRQIYVDPEHVVLIERSKHEQERWGWREEQRRLVAGLWEEVDRCNGELSGGIPHIVPDNEREAADTQKWFARKDAASSISAAYGLAVRQVDSPAYYPAVEATCIQLAVPNARFTMLPVCYVEESPEQVAMLIAGGPW